MMENQRKESLGIDSKGPPQNALSAQNSSTLMAEKVPTPMAPFGGGALIPRALRREKRWAPWVTQWLPKARGGAGKWDKRPGLGKSTARPETWMTFEDAIAEYHKHPGRYAGIGFVTTGQSIIVGVDLDHCVADGVIAPWAADVVAQLASYTEISPSGTGLRIMVTGHVPNDWNNHEVGIEVYGGNTSRFLTITGSHLPGTPLDVRAPPAGNLEGLEKRYAKERAKADVIDISMPDIIDDMLLPSIENLDLPYKAKDFLLDGEMGVDRSLTLFSTAVALYAAGLEHEDAFSLLVHNEYVMGYAMEKRGQDYDKALLYLWRHYCCKGRERAAESGRTTVDDFDVVTPVMATLAWPNFRRDDKGQIKAERENVAMALARGDLTGFDIQHDTFREEMMVATHATEEWRAFKDNDYFELGIRLERGAVGFKSGIPKELIRDGVGYVAEQRKFDSAQLWLNTCQWDGVNRVESSLTRYFGTEATPYTAAIALYFWTALAGRVMEPGVKADMVPVAVGAQGVGKSTTVAAIVPAPEFFLELDLGAKDDDQARLMRGKLIVEMGELKGLRKSDRENLKAFITRTHESWVPKFKEMTTQYARRCVFFGTTNKDEFLVDETGNRRWLPFDAGQCDPAAMATDREQLWAEARELFKKNGVMWRDAERLATDEHAKYAEQDAWDTTVAAWLDTEDLDGTRPGDGWVTSTEVLYGALRIEPKALTKQMVDRMGALLTSIGLKSGRPYIDGKRTRAFSHR